MRLTRADLEKLIRPALQDTHVALRRALRSAALDAADLDALVLVGGSSRIPLAGSRATGRWSPAVDSAAAVRLPGGGVCLLGGQIEDGFAQWWCQQPGFAARLSPLSPARAGVGLARLDRTLYVVGGYGQGFDGTNRVMKYTPPV